MKFFYKWILSPWLCTARHAQITQNNKYVIFLQSVKKEGSDEVDFLYQDTHESFL